MKVTIDEIVERFRFYTFKNKRADELIDRIKQHGIQLDYVPMTDDVKSEILNKAVRGDHQSYDSVIIRTEKAVLARLGVAPTSQEPVVYMCPSGVCQCMWRDNKDGSMSLVMNNKPCAICEPLSLSGLIKLYATPPAPTLDQAAYRFSGWKLPEDFSPDNGISFVRNVFHDRHGMPTGTNLFHHGQVMAMFEYCLDIPAESEPKALPDAAKEVK